MIDSHSTGKSPKYFYVILLLTPIFLIAMLELTLRAANVGADQPLFIEAPEFGDHYYVNPDVIERYVGDKKQVPKVAADATFFSKKKTASTFRIFVQGGSTAAGFPYGRNASLQAMLYQRFKRLYPERKIEIISTAMAAVNSYTLLDFVDEIIEQKPDLVLIYAGHNEFLGVMGVGSKISSSSNRILTLALIQARKLRIFQAMELAIYGSMPTTLTSDKRTLMSKVVGDISIPLDSEKYKVGVSQFRANLSAILDKYSKAKVPVAIANLVSNEQDQAPFSSISNVDWASYKATIGSSDDASTKIRLQNLAISEHSASSNYKLGLNWEALGEYEKARHYFTRALDLDELRFRAPSEFNTIIAELAIEHGAVLADVEKEFLDDTNHKILGEKHLLEHVHPNERGYFLIGEAFTTIVKRDDLLGTPSQKYSREKAWLDNPVTKVDQLSASHMIERLLNDYPFVSTPREVPLPALDTLEAEALSVQGSGIDWRDYRLELVRRYAEKGDLAEAARVAAGTSDAMFSDAELASIAARYYSSLKDYTMARYYLQRATRLASDKRDYWMALAKVYFHLGDTEASAQILSTLK